MGTVSTKMKNILRRLRQSWGSSDAKRRLWNSEFADGRWDHLSETPGDCVYRYVEKYARGGSILDLGCGSGNTGNELDPTKYNRYLGVDISDVAVEKAVERSQRTGRAAFSAYVQSDIQTFIPDGKHSVILFRESLNYVPSSDIVPVLKRYVGFLDREGVIVVRLYDRMRHSSIVDVIRRHFHVIDEYLPSGEPTIVLVFRS